MSFKISKNFLNSDWQNLNITDDNSNNWPDAISIIKERFESRFFDQISQIRGDEFSGFVIMSIDCLIIETMMQFYLGIDNTEEVYKGKQWEVFRDFFTQSRYFNMAFNTDEVCQVFYKQFRCGLLHQAQTKGKSLIRVYGSDFLSLADVNDVKAGLIVDRHQFHKSLLLEFGDYIEKLTHNNDNFNGQNLRKNSILKMNLICSG